MRLRQPCWDVLAELAGRQGGSDDDDGCSLSLILMLLRADILLELAGQNGAPGDDDALKALARTPPPFGSWNTAPACEDDWVDPALELIDLESPFPWEEQVSSCRTWQKDLY